MSLRDDEKEARRQARVEAAEEMLLSANAATAGEHRSINVCGPAFAIHRVVVNEDWRSRKGPPLQLQVSIDGGETWYGVTTTDDPSITLSGSKHHPLRATVVLPIFGGDLGELAEGPLLEWSSTKVSA